MSCTTMSSLSERCAASQSVATTVSLELGEEVVLARLAAEFEPAVMVDDQTKLGAAVCAPIFSLRHYDLPQQFSGRRRAR